jgi:hypothetical protein
LVSKKTPVVRSNSIAGGLSSGASDISLSYFSHLGESQVWSKLPNNYGGAADHPKNHMTPVSFLSLLVKML